MSFEIELPLPPSKNKRKIILPNKKSGGWMPVNTPEVNAYRTELSYKFKAFKKELEEFIGNEKNIYIIMDFRKPRSNSDISNYIDELFDSIQIATGINDKWFVPVCLSPVVDTKNPGVKIVFTYNCNITWE
jgi:hypothetical protein